VIKQAVYTLHTHSGTGETLCKKSSNIDGAEGFYASVDKEFVRVRLTYSNL
jgi:hypothetical protein